MMQTIKVLLLVLTKEDLLKFPFCPYYTKCKEIFPNDFHCVYIICYKIIIVFGLKYGLGLKLEGFTAPPKKRRCNGKTLVTQSDMTDTGFELQTYCTNSNVLKTELTSHDSIITLQESKNRWYRYTKH